MCTPQLRAQAAALQRAADVNTTTPSADDGASPVTDPVRRQMLAVSPVIATQRFAPDSSSSAMGAGTGSALQSTSEERPLIPDIRNDRGISITSALTNTAREGMPSKTGILPGNGKKPQTYDERRAPSVETLAEAARDIRVTSEVFSPRQPGTPTPFAYSKDYRTTPEERRWLMEIEARLGNGSPYLSRLNSRRTEFREAQQNWRDKRQMPWAFISPYRQQYFGRDAFKPAR